MSRNWNQTKYNNSLIYEISTKLYTVSFTRYLD